MKVTLNRTCEGLQPKELHKILTDFLATESEDDQEKEHVWLFGFRNSRLIFCELLHIGGLTSSIVDTRILFKNLITNYCTQFIIAHSHPSGDIEPSTEDDMLTEKLLKAGKILDIELMDHLIITKTEYYSYYYHSRLITT